MWICSHTWHCTHGGWANLGCRSSPSILFETGSFFSCSWLCIPRQQTCELMGIILTLPPRVTVGTQWLQVHGHTQLFLLGTRGFELRSSHLYADAWGYWASPYLFVSHTRVLVWLWKVSNNQKPGVLCERVSWGLAMLCKTGRLLGEFVLFLPHLRDCKGNPTLYSLLRRSYEALG